MKRNVFRIQRSGPFRHRSGRRGIFGGQDREARRARHRLARPVRHIKSRELFCLGVYPEFDLERLIALAKPVRVVQRFESSASGDSGSGDQVAWFPLTTGRMALMCSGPEAQHPPIIRAPIRIQFTANSASREG